MWPFIRTLVKSGAAGKTWKSRLSWECWLNTYLWPLVWLDSERDHLEMEFWRVSAVRGPGRSKETSLSNLPLEAGSICQLPFQWVAKASTKPREVTVHFTSYRQAHLNAFLENAICHNWLVDGINKWLSFFFLSCFHGFFFEVFIEFVTILFLFFMFWFFGHKACGFSAPQQGIELAPPALEGKVLTTDFQGSPLDLFFKKSLIY